MNVKEILSAMIEKDASDLHLIEGNPPSFVIDGALSFFDYKPLTRNDMKSFLDEVVEDTQRKQKFYADKELDFAYELEGKARFRVNAYFQRNSIAFSIRMIPLKISTMEGLGLPGELKEFTRMRSGLVLVIGPAKSGKSTTVAAMVNLINQERSLHIVTIEDPIEYVYKPNKCIISQREVREDTNSAADALKHILRQTPGVVVVDGIKDKESVKMILEGAETGHLVFCTLRAWNVVQSINKLVDFFSESEKRQVRIQISHSLRGVISQRLLKKSDRHGYVCACEALKVNNVIQNLIRDDKLNQIPIAMDDLRKEGMVTMNEAFLSLYKKGVVDIQEIIEHSSGKPGYIETFLLQ
ncbi:MAG: type IV pili twitching motility protein PilT [Syntrophus sp. (in: bacteria)]|nr:type IV pili twitching motility protein PilT [Syntrophus sp. (in: bacteria)]